MLKVLFILSLWLIKSAAVNAQDNNLCDCWLAQFDRKVSSPKECKYREELTDEETLKVMECLLNQKGNRRVYMGGIALKNNLSQTFGSTPIEVAALFHISYLFYENKDFADAIVLLYDQSDEKFNPRKAVKIAHKAYRKWFEEVKKVGLTKARETKLDPLKGTKVSWY